MKEIMLEFGALADPIEEQLNKQGFTLGKLDTYYNDMCRGLGNAYTDGNITDAEYDRILNRLMKHVKKDMIPLKEAFEKETEND